VIILCRHVILPPDITKLVPKTHLMSETEWRNIGVQQSPGWIHYMVHSPGINLVLNKYCEIIYFRWTFNFIGRAIHEFKIPMKYLFTSVILRIIWNSQIKSVHKHVQCRQTTKLNYLQVILEEASSIPSMPMHLGVDKAIATCLFSVILCLWFKYCCNWLAVS